MRILLIRCPPISINDYPPDIGLAYIAACLREDSHEVFIFDLNIELYSTLEPVDKQAWEYYNIHSFGGLAGDLLRKYPVFWKDVISRIVDIQPEIIGFNVWNSNAEISLELTKQVKESLPSVVTVFGGPECYPLLSGLKFAEYPYVDLVIYGEAERTIKKVLDSLCKNGKILPLPGTIVNINGNITDCGWGEYITDLDSLPNLGPALEAFPLELYVKKESLPISFNRGCLYSCKYCPRGMYPKLRCRSAENLIEEIRCLRQMYPDKYSFKVCDASITDNLRQLSRLCDLILSEGIKIALDGFASPNPGLKYGLLTKFKKAGFNSFCYGVETGSERLISQLGKQIKIEAIERVIKETFESGIIVTIDMMVGVASESEEDFKKSMDFLIRNRKYISCVGIAEYAELPYSYIFSHPDEFEIISQEIKRDRHKRMKEVIDSLYLSEAQKFNFVAT